LCAQRRQRGDRNDRAQAATEGGEVLQRFLQFSADTYN
jgi:hypothetical protein